MKASAKDLAALLPPRFTLGVATAAFQIEGALDEDGRGPSGWDVFAAKPGAIVEDHSPAVACDHYHRMPEDVALMKELGIDSYRFSLSWSRIQPGGSGPVNPAGLDFYDRLIDLLLANGIAPMATLYHWDTPLELDEAGRLDEPGHGLPAGGVRRDRRGRVRRPGHPLGHRQRTRHGQHQRLHAGDARAGRSAHAEGPAQRPPPAPGPRLVAAGAPGGQRARRNRDHQCLFADGARLDQPAGQAQRRPDGHGPEPALRGPRPARQVPRHHPRRHLLLLLQPVQRGHEADLAAAGLLRAQLLHAHPGGLRPGRGRRAQGDGRGHGR